MTTSSKISANEQAASGRWVRYRAAGYLRSRGLTFGADDIFPAAANDLGRYSVNVSPVKSPITDVCDDRVDIFADGQLDHLFIGRLLEGVEDTTATLRTLTRKLRVGGHLIVHLPINAGGEYEHHRFDPEGMVQLVAQVGRWQAKDSYQQGDHFLQIYKKLEGKRGVLPAKPRSGKPRACVVRYGALGDMVILTPLLRRLAEDGYEVTLNITPYAAPVVEGNPFVSNLILQEREVIPNEQLGPYWDLWKGDYEKYVNLSESLEGSLLRVEGRKNFYTHQSWRIATGEKNYYDATMERGGYPEAKGLRGELFFTAAEERKGRAFFEPLAGKFVILWALNGSANHKVYPLFEQAATTWLDAHPDSVIVTVGDYTAKLLEFDHPRLIKRCGEWAIRESMIAAKLASCVIGPESFIINCSGCFDTPKIPLLSHSTHRALCANFLNDHCLAPDTSIAPCHPCFQLKYTANSCPIGQFLDEDGHVAAEGPLCVMGAISVERVLETLQTIYNTNIPSQPDSHYVPA